MVAGGLKEKQREGGKINSAIFVHQPARGHGGFINAAKKNGRTSLARKSTNPDRAGDQ